MLIANVTYLKSLLCITDSFFAALLTEHSAHSVCRKYVLAQVILPLGSTAKETFEKLFKAESYCCSLGCVSTILD